MCKPTMAVKLSFNCSVVLEMCHIFEYRGFWWREQLSAWKFDIGWAVIVNVGLESKDLKDPGWFERRYRQREAIRKQNADAPLSEEEFDWFLQMFEEREKLRQSKDGQYPKTDPDDQEVDWFLKMFEARARLRFCNEDRDKDWREKMAAARNPGRSDEKPTDWYTGMAEAREALRRGVEKRGWLSVMVAGWEKLHGKAILGWVTIWECGSDLLWSNCGLRAGVCVLLPEMWSR